MDGARWWLVCYDVRDPDRLRRAAKHLEGYGSRVQYSVFRCWMTARDLQRLRWELTAMLPVEDDVMFIPLCSQCVHGIQSTHAAEKPVQWPSQPEGHRLV